MMNRRNTRLLPDIPRLALFLCTALYLAEQADSFVPGLVFDSSLLEGVGVN